MNKKYIRKGFEDRAPQSKAQYILAWIKEGLFDNVFDAGDEFEEDVAYGTIIEVPTTVKADDRETGQVYQGCICPPTSEQTCMNSTCPRRNYYQPYTPYPSVPNQPSYPSYPPVCPSITPYPYPTLHLPT